MISFKSSLSFNFLFSLWLDILFLSHHFVLWNKLVCTCEKVRRTSVDAGWLCPPCIHIYYNALSTILIWLWRRQDFFPLGCWSICCSQSIDGLCRGWKSSSKERSPRRWQKEEELISLLSFLFSLFGCCGYIIINISSFHFIANSVIISFFLFSFFLGAAVMLNCIQLYSVDINRSQTIRNTNIINNPRGNGRIYSCCRSLMYLQGRTKKEVDGSARRISHRRAMMYSAAVLQNNKKKPARQLYPNWISYGFSACWHLC